MWPKLYALHNAKGLNSVRLRVTWGVMVRVHGIELLWVDGLGVRLVGLCLTDLGQGNLSHTASGSRGGDF